MLHNEFSKEVEEKVMTIAQHLRASGFKEGIENENLTHHRQPLT
jgi:hypothetical protein